MVTELHEVDALASDAIAASEREFFRQAFDKTEDDGPALTDGPGDRTLEQMGGGLEGQREGEEPEPDAEEHEERAEPKPDVKAEGDRPTSEQGERGADGRYKPQGQQRQETEAERGLRRELTGEREKKRTLESEFAAYREQTARDIAAINARLVQAAQPQAPQPKVEEPKVPTPPSFWEDPEGYQRWAAQQLRDQVLGEVRAMDTQREQARVLGSFNEARSRHGAAFQEAYAAANAVPENHPLASQIVNQIMRSQNPGEVLIAWHRNLKASQEIGADPTAFKQRVLEEQRKALMDDPEFRRTVLATLQQEARAGGSNGARPITDLPPSLSSARGGSPSRTSGGASDRSLFNEALA